MVDNQPAIALAKNLVLHDRSKHIDMKFHFLRDYVDGGQIVIEFVKTGRQLADVLTKLLGRHRLTELKEIIGMEGVQGIAVGLGEELLDIICCSPFLLGWRLVGSADHPLLGVGAGQLDCLLPTAVAVRQ